MIQLAASSFDTLAEMVGDTPFTITPYFLLQRRACEAYADSAGQPRCVVIIPNRPHPDIYVMGAHSLESADLDDLAAFLAGLDSAASYLVPVELVHRIRALRPIHVEVEGLCFSYRQLPTYYPVWRPELVRRLGPGDESLLETLPGDAGFLFHNYGTPAALLQEGLAFGVLQAQKLVSMSVSLALTSSHCDVGAYTRRRYRHRGYATDCVEALFAHVMQQGIHPLWRIGVRQKIAIYFAEKLGMDEIGTDGQEVFLQTHPA